MIVVRVELWSAINGHRTELARMSISNDGTGTDAVCDYNGETLTGRSREALDSAMKMGRITRRGRVEGHRRHDLHIWHLVARMLATMGYGLQPAKKAASKAAPKLALECAPSDADRCGEGEGISSVAHSSLSVGADVPTPSSGQDLFSATHGQDRSDSLEHNAPGLSDPRFYKSGSAE